MAYALQIVNGPSKFGLMESLFEGNPTPRKKVKFVLELEAQGGIEMEVAITGIEQEGGSGESWNFTGYSMHGRVKGYYSSRDRRGHVRYGE